MKIEDIIGSKCKECGSPIQVVQTANTCWIAVCSNIKCMSVCTERSVVK